MILQVLHCTPEHELWCNNSRSETPLFLDLWHNASQLAAFEVLNSNLHAVVSCYLLLVFLTTMGNGKSSKLMDFDNLNWHIYCEVPLTLQTPHSYLIALLCTHLQDVDSE